MIWPTGSSCASSTKTRTKWNDKRASEGDVRLALKIAADDLAPLAADLPDGTPHADPLLAGRGWQAQGGIYARSEPEASS
jgi:hypothetical protein